MITLEQYVGRHADSPDWTPLRIENAQRLLRAVARLEAIMRGDGVEFLRNPKTMTEISGETLGGFRPQSCQVGAPMSNHKRGLAVDIYDPDGSIDLWCVTHREVLADCGIWIEHPDATRGWSHWQCVAPRSGRRVFMP